MTDEKRVSVEISDKLSENNELKRILPDELPGISLFTDEVYFVDKFEFKRRLNFTAAAVILCLICLAYYIASGYIPKLNGILAAFIWFMGASGVIMLAFLPGLWGSYGKYDNQFGCRGIVAEKYIYKSKVLIFPSNKYMVTVIEDGGEGYICEVECRKKDFNKLSCGSHVLVTCRDTRNPKAWFIGK